MERAFLMPGEERWRPFKDQNGVSKGNYTYCSLHGSLFSCTCRDLDEAKHLCEDWLVGQDRCYRN